MPTEISFETAQFLSENSFLFGILIFFVISSLTILFWKIVGIIFRKIFPKKFSDVQQEVKKENANTLIAPLETQSKVDSGYKLERSASTVVDNHLPADTKPRWVKDEEGYLEMK